MYKRQDDEIGSVCRIIEQTNNTLRKYVNDISTHIDEMSHGDFTHAVTLDYTGDFAPIKASLNHIISELGGVFSDINDAAAVVYSGAGNVSQGAASLAESASKQTSLVDEISGEVASTDKIINDNVNKRNHRGYRVPDKYSRAQRFHRSRKSRRRRKRLCSGR